MNASRPHEQQEPGTSPPSGGAGGEPAADELRWELLPAIADGEKFDRLAFPTRSVGYAASRTALHKTEDGGKSWHELPGRPGRVFVLHFESEHVGWLGTDQLRHTRDGGRIWTSVVWPGDRQAGRDSRLRANTVSAFPTPVLRSANPELRFGAKTLSAAA